MFQVLMILSSVTCLYLTNKVLAQQSSTSLHCIQHHQPENSCYEMNTFIGMNGTFVSETVTTISHDPNTKLFTITFDQDFFNVHERAGMLNVTILKLCHEEALKLTLSDVDLCGLSCTTETFQQIENSVTVNCGEENFIDTFLNGNRTVIAFMPNGTIQSCNNLTAVNLVLVDTDGKPSFMV